MKAKDIREAFKNGFQGVRSLITKLYNKIKNLETKVSTLEARNKELEGKLKKLIDEKEKDSHNSSKPPSTDGLKKKPKTKSLRGKSNKKLGGQKGHKGKTLEMTLSPDEIIKLELKRYHCCSKKVLKKKKQIIVRQVIGIDGKKHVIEYQSECSTCPDCNKKSIAPFPEYCTKKIQYSPEVKALAVYLNKYQLIPLKRVSEIFLDLFNIQISEGSIVNFSALLFDKLQGFEEECKEALLNSELIHNDESGGRCEKKLHWFQVISNQFITFIAFHRKRGTKAMNDIGILPNFKGKTVHDFYPSYFQFDIEHILCNAHLLRELVFEYEQNSQKWAGEMINLLLKIKEKVRIKKEKKHNCLSQYYIQTFEKEFERILNLGFKNNPYQKKEEGKRGRSKQTSSRNLLDRLSEYKKSYLGFMYDFSVPFDNNLAERDIRMLKVYMKVSGCFRTFSGAAYFCRIRSYISTVRKNNINTFQAINAAFINKPFSLNQAE